jgi:DNA-binding LacI/PurR family transcriptional regulator
MQNFNLATLLDVTRLSNASVKEVMSVLNGQPVVPEVHQRILDAIAKLGSVNIPATQAHKETKTIGVIIDRQVVDDYTGNVISGITRTVQELGYHMTIHTWEIEETSAKMEQYLRFLFATNNANDAFIVVVPYPYNDVIADTCREFNCPCILMDSDGSEGQPTVLIDNYKSMRNVMDHLISLGHQRIAFIEGPSHMLSATERLKAYQDALQEEGLTVDDQIVVQGNFMIPSGADRAREIIEYAPTAIACANDLMALGAIDAVKQLGLHIPHDVSITGFDDIPLAASINPSLTTIRQPMPQMGEAAVRMAATLLKGEELPNRVLTYHGDLIVRGSTGPAK